MILRDRKPPTRSAGWASRAAVVAWLGALAACGGSGPSTSSPASTVAPTASASQPSSGTTDACTLLTAKDASTLAGATMTPEPSTGGTDCAYAGVGGPGVSGVEITIRVDGDAATAHSDFPRWVQPFPGTGPGFTNTPISGIGDEAAETHSGTVIAGIFFRHGTALIKIGTSPPASDTALRAAAMTVLSRL